MQPPNDQLTSERCVTDSLGASAGGLHQRIVRVCACGCKQQITSKRKNVKYIKGHFKVWQTYWPLGVAALQASRKKPNIEARRIAALRNSDALKKHCQNVQAARLEGCKQSPLTRRGIENAHSKIWNVRSPRRKEYQFINANEFIRNNPELFEPDDLIPKPRIPNALKGLSSIRPDGRRVAGSWKGWQWISNVEREVGNNDLLAGDSTAHPNEKVSA